MNVKVDSKVLLKAMSLAAKIVDPDSRAQRFVLIETGEDSVTLYANDFEVGLTTELPAKVKNQGSSLIEGKGFHKIVKALPGSSPEVSIAAKDDKTIVRCGRVKYVLTGIGFELYTKPVQHEVEEQEAPSAHLKELIESVIHSAAESPDRNLHGAYLHQDGSDAVLVAMDGHRLSKVTSREISLQEEIYIPRKGLERILQLIKSEDSETCKFGTLGSKMWFELGSSRLVVSLIDFTYPSYKDAIPRIFKFEVSADREVLTAALKRMAIVTDRSADEVTFRRVDLESSGDGTLVLQAVDSESRKGKETIEVKGKLGETFKVSFNVDFLLQALASFPAKVVTLSVVDETSPMKITSEDMDNHLEVVMPMR